MATIDILNVYEAKFHGVWVIVIGSMMGILIFYQAFVCFLLLQKISQLWKTKLSELR